MFGVVSSCFNQVSAQLPGVCDREEHEQTEEDASQLQPENAAQPDERSPSRLSEALTSPHKMRARLPQLFDGAGWADGYDAGLSRSRLRPGRGGTR